MAKDRKTANLFEVLKSASLEKERSQPGEARETPEPMPLPAAEVGAMEASRPAVEAPVVPKPVVPPAAPVSSVMEKPAVRTPPLPMPSEPAIRIGERQIQMTATTALFLGLIVLAVLCIIFVLGREYEKGRSGSGSSVRPRTSGNTGQPPARTVYSIEVKRGAARTARDRVEADKAFEDLKKILRDQRMDPNRLSRKEDARNGEFIFYYGEYADRGGAEQDKRKLAQIQYGPRYLAPEISALQK